MSNIRYRVMREADNLAMSNPMRNSTTAIAWANHLCEVQNTQMSVLAEGPTGQEVIYVTLAPNGLVPQEEVYSGERRQGVH